MNIDKVKVDIYKHIDPELLKSKGIDYDKIFENTLNKFIEEINNVIIIDTTPLINEIKRIKLNWRSYEKRNSKSLYSKQINATDVLFKSNRPISDFTNAESFKESIEKKLKDWLSPQYLLIEFPYIIGKRKNTIEKALEKDILLALSLEKLEERKSDDITKTMENENCDIMPNSLSNIPIDISNTLKLEESEENFLYKYSNNETEYIYKIKIDDFNNILSSNAATKVINIIKKVLNRTDIRVFNYLLKFRDDNFFENGIVKTDLEQMCKDLFGYNKEQYRNNIIGSLYKMAVIKGNGYTEGITSILASLLNDVIIKKENGKTIVTASVGMVYRNDVLRGNITKIYGNMFDKITDNDDIYIIAFYLQSRRLQQYFCKDKDIARYAGFCEKRVPYTAISNYCMISGKNKSRTKKRINNALKLIADEKCIISEFTLVGDYYDITYAPLAEEELIDIEKRVRIPESSLQDTQNTFAEEKQIK